MIYSIISNDIIFKNLENEKSTQYEEINIKEVCYRYAIMKIKAILLKDLYQQTPMII